MRAARMTMFFTRSSSTDGDKLDDVAEEEMRRIPTVVEVDTEDEEDADYQDDDEEDEDDEEESDEESDEESEEEDDDDLPDDQLHMSSKNQTGYLGVKVLRGKGADEWKKEKHRCRADPEEGRQLSDVGRHL